MVKCRGWSGSFCRDGNTGTFHNSSLQRVSSEFQGEVVVIDDNGLVTPKNRRYMLAQVVQTTKAQLATLLHCVRPQNIIALCKTARRPPRDRRQGTIKRSRELQESRQMKRFIREREPSPFGSQCSFLTVQQELLAVWIALGVVPLILQIRSYAQFVRPHKIAEVLAVPPEQQQETANLTEVCPVEAFVLAGVWWNIEPTHYYYTEDGIICHTVVPQYNTHGNYFIGKSKVAPYRTSPASCVNDSFEIQVYLYHASIGFYSFYEGEVGTYCSKGKTAYIAVEVLGTYDINGSILADDTGSTDPRVSYWYGIVGAVWLVYRLLIICRGYSLLRLYGRRCDGIGESLQQQAVVVFVQESLRLSAHGATNYQRVALLYLVIEGIMTDLFLIIANDGWATRIQYTSLGYNLSGLMLLLFEMLEKMRWLTEAWRMRVKRLVFSYESSLVGELVAALAFQYFLTGLNKSELKRSKPEALAVSSSAFCDNVCMVQTSITCYVSQPCCVDMALGMRSRIVLLGGYHWEDGKLFYEQMALKAFGMLKMEENGVQYLLLHKLHWFAVPRETLVGIGVISSERVEPCNERPCTGIISFLDRKLGGISANTDSNYRTQQSWAS
ncbi:unnamed protein product [Phytophthora fragariaefolia]|uniref:Unnamed protein product n=1 Tax=Phytophthora fragariaefolia TaxID=1490495 RepID=A0A9W7CKG8_9STRA|nr:unnamed protein product [Phytophthora fragariaefolia]